MKVPVGPGQDRVLPVLVKVLDFSRLISAVMLPSWQDGDLLAGMWQVIEGWGRVPKSLVLDREAAIGGTGKPTTEVGGVRRHACHSDRVGSGTGSGVQGHR